MWGRLSMNTNTTKTLFLLSSLCITQIAYGVDLNPQLDCPYFIPFTQQRGKSAEYLSDLAAFKRLFSFEETCPQAEPLFNFMSYTMSSPKPYAHLDPLNTLYLLDIFSNPHFLTEEFTPRLIDFLQAFLTSTLRPTTRIPKHRINIIIRNLKHLVDSKKIDRSLYEHLALEYGKLS